MGQWLKPEDRIGRVLADRYRIDGIIGRGAMGVVYDAKHTWLDRPVAIKTLIGQHASRSDLVQRFFQEARTAANLRHPNIVEVLDMGEDDDGVPFLAMERLEGETLASLLTREGRIGFAQAARIVVPLMDALAAVHERGVLHRDLKPDNIFLSRDFRGRMQPKIVDFGVAKLMEGGTFTTKTGAIVGTPIYMSPEQTRGAKDLGPPTDVWAMGVILFRCLAGRLPIELAAADAMMHVVLNDLPSLATHNVEPSSMVALVDSALRRDAAQRPSTMHVMLDRVLAAAHADGIELADPRA